AQVQELPLPTRQRAAERDSSGFGAGERNLLDHAFDHHHRELAGGEVLLRQIDARRDVTAANVAIRDIRHELLDVANLETPARVRLHEPRAFGVRQVRSTLDRDLADVPTRTHAR